MPEKVGIPKPDALPPEHETGEPKRLSRIIGRPFPPGYAGRFLPGRSGNPSGRPNRVSHYIQRLCGKDYHKLSDGLHALAFGSAAEREAFFGEPVTVTARDRRECMTALFDRGLGRPPTLSAAPAVAGGPRIVIALPFPEDELEGCEIIHDARRLE